MFKFINKYSVPLSICKLVIMPKCVLENCDSGSRKKGKNQKQIEYGQLINAKSINLKTGKHHLFVWNIH